MLNDVRRKLAKKRFDWLCRRILDTPPIQPRPAPVRVVSMVRTHDVRMYLIAVKSLYRFLPGGEIVIMDDGTLTGPDRALLRRHLGEPSFVQASAVPNGPCPRGGTWERLLHILDLSRDSYVIQLDSDMLAVAPIPEVVAAVRDNVAFTLGSQENLSMVELETAAADVADADAELTQILAERTLPLLPAGLGRRYVRGSSGFAGFARGGSSRRVAEAFSAAMQASMGQRWSEWGTEQVASNYLVANSPNGSVLPWPKYCCFYPGVAEDEAAALHFIGTWRFQRGVYVDKARRVIAELKGPRAAAPA